MFFYKIFSLYHHSFFSILLSALVIRWTECGWISIVKPYADVLLHGPSVKKRKSEIDILIYKTFSWCYKQRIFPHFPLVIYFSLLVSRFIYLFISLHALVTLSVSIYFFIYFPLFLIIPCLLCSSVCCNGIFCGVKQTFGTFDAVTFKIWEFIISFMVSLCP